jgi:hypothetical protein
LTQPARRQATLHVGINQWITVAWCAVGHDATSLRRIEGTLRPYHTLLMSSEAAQAALPRDCSPALYRLAMHANPLKRYDTMLHLCMCLCFSNPLLSSRPALRR